MSHTSMEYLIFNLIVISGPLVLSFMKPYYFVHRWGDALISIVLVGIPFIAWDAIVTGSHWFFNEAYILGIHIVRLPIEEVMFFITVPFSCIFIWEMLVRKKPEIRSEKIRALRKYLIVLPLIGLILFARGLEYTGLVFIFLGIAVLVDRLLKTDILLQKRFYIFVTITAVLNLIFNGFLTWRPVVMYGETFQLGYRIFTIPIEDFGYGFALLFMNVSVYEKLKLRRAEQSAVVEPAGN